MVNFNQEELRRLQLIELEMLIEFDRICSKYNIRYSLTGGTLLGAVRNQGFIPWDDDADVSMMRKDYEKFSRVCEKELDHSRFYFQDHTNTPGYRWGYGKLRRKDTLFVRENQEHMPYEQGVFIDIFPRDGVPDNKLLRLIHGFLCFCVRKTLWSPVGAVAEHKGYKRIWYRFLYKFTNGFIWNLYNGLVKVSNRKETELIRALTFPLPKPLKGYRRKGCDGAKRVEFENYSFSVNSNYKEWLKDEFGNYMELPPMEKRKVHPVSELKLLRGR